MEEPVAPHSEPESTKTRHSRVADSWSFAAEIIKTLVVVIFLAYVIRVYIIQPFIVDGMSMYPQFHNNDYLLVDKLSYRIEAPSRGDIIVFQYPRDTSVDYIKRIIGLPGETVRIENSHVYIINASHPNGFELTEPYVSPNNKTFGSLEGQTDFVVPAGQYFVMGDNREASSDSRQWGDLPRGDIIGRVLVQVYPTDRFAILPHATYPSS